MAHLLINIKSKNINRVFKSFSYHSRQKTLCHRSNPGDYIFFISRLNDSEYKLVGYFYVVKSAIEKPADKFGEYTVYGDPKLSKLIEPKNLIPILSDLSIKTKSLNQPKLSSKKIGMATQIIRKLTESDKEELINYTTNAQEKI